MAPEAYSLITYDRAAALAYAEKWAFLRNPKYYNFDGLGGDCTNFASQCLYAGCRVMNFRPVMGWFYIDLNRRAPAWTGVKYFFNFMTSNASQGPFGHECERADLVPGDFVQLYRGKTYTHTLIVISISPSDTYVASHTADSFNRPLSSFWNDGLRYIHIDGARRRN